MWRCRPVIEPRPNTARPGYGSCSRACRDALAGVFAATATGARKRTWHGPSRRAPLSVQAADDPRGQEDRRTPDARSRLDRCRPGLAGGRDPPAAGGLGPRAPDHRVAPPDQSRSRHDRSGRSRTVAPELRRAHRRHRRLRIRRAGDLARGRDPHRSPSCTATAPTRKIPSTSSRTIGAGAVSPPRTSSAAASWRASPR